MVRPIMSYVLASIILLSQSGLPVHMHYCKGMLESVSVFFNQGCDDHNQVADLPACCRKMETSTCSTDGGNCCDDKVTILIQDINSLIPQFVKWVFVVPVSPTILLPEQHSPEIIAVTLIPGIISDAGPPFYILHKSLIFYA